MTDPDYYNESRKTYDTQGCFGVFVAALIMVVAIIAFIVIKIFVR